METGIFLIDLVSLEATLLDAIFDANPNLSDEAAIEILNKVFHHAIDDYRLRELTIELR